MATPVTLKVFRGDELVRTEHFTRDIIKIGRLSSAHLCLEDERISRIHSVIEVGADGRVSIIDMGSAEGTFVNGKRISKGPLRHGDEIKLGGLRIVLEGEGVAALTQAVNRALDVPITTPAPGSKPAANGHGNGRAAHGQNGHARVAAPLAQGAAAVALGQAAERAATPAPVAAPVRRRPAMALTRPVDEEPVEDGAPDLGVELRVLWGEALLDAGTFVAPKQPVLIGEGPRCHFRLTGPDLPVDAFPILRHDEGEYRFLFARGMRGGVQEKGKLVTFGELVKARRASQDESVEGAWAIAMPRAGAVVAELGSGLKIEARFRRPPKPAAIPWYEKLDYRYLNLLLVLLFLQGGFIVAAKTTTRDVDLVQDDLAKGQQRMAKFVMKAPEQQKVNPYLEKLKADLKREQPGEMAEKHKGDEGQMGKKDAPKTNGRSAPKAIDPNAKELVKNSGLLAALGKGKGAGGLSTVFGVGGLGGDLKGAIGNMYGPVVGDSHGVGGLGLKGIGPGGGGQGETIGIGAVGTKGRGGGLGGYGSGVGGLGSKRDRDIAISTGDTKILGAIDPELIRKVIRDHADQVRYCYEQQLTLNPKLGGKIAIKWQINADGRASATVFDTNVPVESDGMRNVGECIMSRIKTWEFPKPKGGGMAIVTYPWILRSSGSGSAG
ncbi:MAG TPA: adventurous gliding motility protein GltG [Anaeromyxobacteraceae bacterium]|nr:adventurous gliding motility protein GltG [Anaeromyxobacteraceae bacterium]